MLRAVHKHRYLTREHIAALVFPYVTRAVPIGRLRKLWAHKYLDRYFFPQNWHHPAAPRGLKTPTYCIGKEGAKLLAPELGVSWRDVPHTHKTNREGFASLQHHLVATDMLVALEVALRGRRDAQLVLAEREARMRSAVSTRMQRGRRLHHIISDGAFTLEHDSWPAPRTFHLEVVRASVKGGNETFIRKLRKYAKLYREGFFKDVYGHDRIRAVLVAATTEQRAQNLREMAARELIHGRNLFWFTGYEREPSAGPPITHFTPETVFDPRWVDLDGNTHSLLEP